jgi:hypothetical protein
MKPIGIQRQRIKGWRMPENTKCVTRPGIWGNPFEVTELITQKKAVELFEECLLNNHMAYYYFDELKATEVYNHFKYISENLGSLKGYNLACFCKLDSDCHRDVLLKYANL